MLFVLETLKRTLNRGMKFCLKYQCKNSMQMQWFPDLKFRNILAYFSYFENI
jgi:hypothetical protein